MKRRVLSGWLRWLRRDPLMIAMIPAARRAEVREAIERTGRWEHHEEWRITTVTSSLIERTDEPGWRKYLVRVECDYVLEARCPTLSRAVEIQYIYEHLVPRLWRRHGWPSWATRTQLEATDDTA